MVRPPRHGRSSLGLPMRREQPAASTTAATAALAAADDLPSERICTAEFIAPPARITQRCEYGWIDFPLLQFLLAATETISRPATPSTTGAGSGTMIRLRNVTSWVSSACSNANRR